MGLNLNFNQFIIYKIKFLRLALDVKPDYVVKNQYRMLAFKKQMVIDIT